MRFVVIALKYEWNLWRSLYRWVFRRPLVREPDARPFGYSGPLTLIFIAFIGVSTIEVPILHLILPWPTIRLTALALGVYGVVWMIGLLASLRVYPHVVAPSSLRVRHSFTIDIHVPWEIVDEIRVRNRTLEPGRKLRFEETDAGRVASLAISNFTNVDVTFREPVALAVPKIDGEPLVGLRFYADDADALVAYARTRVMAG